MSAETDATSDDWARLDLAPDAEPRAIRAAYARKLKTTRPDADPEAFQALSEAYQRLLAASATPVAESTPAESQVDPQAVAALVHAFDARRRRGDGAAALAAIDDGLAGTLRLAWRQGVEDALFDSVARDHSASPSLMQGLAARFDWREASSRQDERDAEHMKVCRERIEAADLADAYRARARAAADGTGPAADRVLATILGPYRVGLFDRALDEPSREVAAEFMGAFYQKLDRIDGLADARMLASVRAALGAAPLAAPPPDVTAAPQATSMAAEASAGAATAKNEGRKSIGWIVTLLVVGCLNVFSHSNRTTPPTTHNAPSAGFGQSDRPAVPNSLEFVPRGAGYSINLHPIRELPNATEVSAVQLRFLPGPTSVVVDSARLSDAWMVDTPKDATSVDIWLRYVDGSTSDAVNFSFGTSGPANTPEAPAKPDLPTIDHAGPSAFDSAPKLDLPDKR